MQGSVKVWDPRQKDEPVANMEPGEGQDRRDCWCVAFGRISFTNVQQFNIKKKNIHWYKPNNPRILKCIS